MTRFSILLGALAITFLPSAGDADRFRAAGDPPGLAEVVVTFSSPAVAGATGRAGRAARAAVDREHGRFASALQSALPEARIRWRYRVVLNGVAVVLPRRDIARLAGIEGVRAVDSETTYRSATTAAQGLSAMGNWKAGLPNKGAGMKIGIIDDGVDQRHPYFAPADYVMPPGFPKGQTAYTTAKVIVARAFPPPGTAWKSAGKPFDPTESRHATHVAGIAAGNPNTAASGGTRISGVAPLAYIGNYKALTVPTDAGVGLDGNAAELVAAIEAAVVDGMDVINLSIGEPEIEPSRDLVALALDAAARAGVIPVVAAGNDFDSFGLGSLASPGTSAGAITVAAVSISGGTARPSLASFSSSGPTALSLRLKPDISAPGVSILSSVPSGGWATMSGTSMATPQVAGAAALLLERHPDWPVADVKAALIGTGTLVEANNQVAAPTRGGGGLADPARADVPLLLAAPASISLGLVRPGAAASVRIDLRDAGGGAGTWDVAVDTVTAPVGAFVTAPPTVTVPGSFEFSPTVGPDAAEGDLTGFVRLTRGPDVRRIPFWLRVVRPALEQATVVHLRKQGAHAGDTRGRPALVSRYRYPDVPAGGEISTTLSGPEQVFRVTLTRSAANFGVVVVGRERGVRVEPRVVSAGNENRLTGYPALPVNLNPYLVVFGSPVLAAGAVRPVAGSYDIVFDSPTPGGAGRYTFRFWINDVRPPAAVLGIARIRRGQPLTIRTSDSGSGIDPTTAVVRINGSDRAFTITNGKVTIATTGLRRGKHRLRFQISDYQESRNMENVPPILPNTRVLTATIVVR